jgi:pantothenate kinase-related protein Tda10
MVARLVEAITDRLAGGARPLVVAIDGRSGTGKSTLAGEAAPLVDAAVIGADTFFSGGDDSYWRTRRPRERNAEVTSISPSCSRSTRRSGCAGSAVARA